MSSEISGVIGKEAEQKGIRIADLERAEQAGKEITAYGLDGTLIKILVDNKRIIIHEGSSYWFVVTLKQGICQLSIENEKYGIKSKTIFPSKLVDFMFKKWGDKIKVIKAVWLSDSVNNQQYYEALKQGKTQIEAARSTWTGRTIANFGFTRVAKVEEGQIIFVSHFSEFSLVPMCTRRTINHPLCGWE